MTSHMTKKESKWLLFQQLLCKKCYKLFISADDVVYATLHCVYKAYKSDFKVG